MTATTDALPDDPDTLRAMLPAERAHTERLEQIIKQLQRHRFGHRAETLPEDQLLFGLEEVERMAASTKAENEAAAPAERARHPPSGASTVGRCRRICRASRWWSTSAIMSARVAATRCIGLARI